MLRRGRKSQDGSGPRHPSRAPTPHRAGGDRSPRPQGFGRRPEDAAHTAFCRGCTLSRVHTRVARTPYAFSGLRDALRRRFGVGLEGAGLGRADLPQPRAIARFCRLPRHISTGGGYGPDGGRRGPHPVPAPRRAGTPPRTPDPKFVVSLDEGEIVEDQVAVDAKRILLRYGAPIAILDRVPQDERVEFARMIARTELSKRQPRLKELLQERGYLDEE